MVRCRSIARCAASAIVRVRRGEVSFVSITTSGSTGHGVVAMVRRHDVIVAVVDLVVAVVDVVDVAGVAAVVLRVVGAGFDHARDTFDHARDPRRRHLHPRDAVAEERRPLQLGDVIERRRVGEQGLGVVRGVRHAALQVGAQGSDVVHALSGDHGVDE